MVKEKKLPSTPPKSDLSKSPKQAKESKKEIKNGVADEKKAAKKVSRGSKESSSSSFFSGKFVISLSIVVLLISAGAYLLLSNQQHGETETHKMSEYSAAEILDQGLHALRKMFGGETAQEDEETVGSSSGDVNYQSAEDSQKKEKEKEEEEEEEEEEEDEGKRVERDEFESRRSEHEEESPSKSRDDGELNEDAETGEVQMKVEVLETKEEEVNADDDDDDDDDDDETSEEGEREKFVEHVHEHETESRSDDVMEEVKPEMKEIPEETQEPDSAADEVDDKETVEWESPSKTESEEQKSTESGEDENESERIESETVVKSLRDDEEDEDKDLIRDQEAIDKIGDIKSSEYFKLVGDDGGEDYKETIARNEELYKRFKDAERSEDLGREIPKEVQGRFETESTDEAETVELDGVSQTDDKISESKSETQEESSVAEDEKDAEQEVAEVEKEEEEEVAQSVRPDDDGGRYTDDEDSPMVTNKLHDTKDSRDIGFEDDKEPEEEVDAPAEETVNSNDEKLGQVDEEQSEDRDKERTGDDEEEMEVNKEEKLDPEEEDAKKLEDEQVTDDEIEIIDAKKEVNLDQVEEEVERSEVKETIIEPVVEDIDVSDDSEREGLDGNANEDKKDEEKSEDTSVDQRGEVPDEMKKNEEEEDEKEKIDREITEKIERGIKEIEEEIAESAREAVSIYHARLLLDVSDHMAALGKAMALADVWRREGGALTLEDALDTYFLLFSLPPLSRKLSYTSTFECVRLLEVDSDSQKDRDNLRRETLLSLLDMYPERVDEFNDLALTFLEEGHFKAAKVAFQLVLEKDPLNIFAKLYLGCLLKIHERDFQAAADLMFPIFEQNQMNIPDTRIYLELGEALSRLGRKEEARHIYSKAVDAGLLLTEWQHSVVNVPGLVNRVWWSKEQLSEQNQRLFTEMENYWFNIREEVLRVAEDVSMEEGMSLPMNENADVGGAKRIVLFSFREKNTTTCVHFPATCRMIENIPDVTRCQQCEAQIYIIEADTILSGHISPSNSRIRADLGLSLAGNDQIIVRGERRAWQLGRFLFYDPSFDREWLIGESSEVKDESLSTQVEGLPLSGNRRAILSIDFWHPELNDDLKEGLRSL